MFNQTSNISHTVTDDVQYVQKSEKAFNIGRFIYLFYLVGTEHINGHIRNETQCKYTGFSRVAIFHP